MAALCDHRVDDIFDALIIRIEPHFGVLRRFVDLVNSGEIANLALTRLAVETLRVACLADGQRSINENLKKLARGEQFAGGVAVFENSAVRRVEPYANRSRPAALERLGSCSARPPRI